MLRLPLSYLKLPLPPLCKLPLLSIFSQSPSESMYVRRYVCAYVCVYACMYIWSAHPISISHVHYFQKAEKHANRFLLTSSSPLCYSRSHYVARVNTVLVEMPPTPTKPCQICVQGRREVKSTGYEQHVGNLPSLPNG